MPAGMPKVCINKIQLTDASIRLDLLVKEYVTSLESSFFYNLAPHDNYAHAFRVSVTQAVNGAESSHGNHPLDPGLLHQYLNRSQIKDGKYEISIPLSVTFDLPKIGRLDSLAYAVYPFVEDAPDEVNRVLGRYLYAETVIEDGSIVSEISAYTLLDRIRNSAQQDLGYEGTVWSGPVQIVDYSDRTPEGLPAFLSGYVGPVALHESTGVAISRLKRHTIPNNKVLDLRTNRGGQDSPYKSQGEIYAESAPLTVAEKTFNIFSAINDRLDVPSRGPYVNLVGACYTGGDHRRIQFNFDFRKMIEDEMGAVPGINIDDIMEESRITSLRILRRGVKDRQFVTKLKSEYVPLVGDAPRVLIGDNEINTPIDKQHSDIFGEVSIRELPNPTDGQIRTFMCKEKIESSGYRGLYQYGVEIEVENGLSNILKMDLMTLAGCFKTFTKYYNLSLGRTEGRLNYDQQLNKFSSDFAANLKPEQEHALENYFEIYDRYYDTERDEKNQHIMSSTNMVHPENASPESILQFAGYISMLQSRLQTIESALTSFRHKMPPGDTRSAISSSPGNSGRAKGTISFKRFFEDSDCDDRDGATLRAPGTVIFFVDNAGGDQLNFEQWENRLALEKKKYDSPKLLASPESETDYSSFVGPSTFGASDNAGSDALVVDMSTAPKPSDDDESPDGQDLLKALAVMNFARKAMANDAASKNPVRKSLNNPVASVMKKFMKAGSLRDAAQGMPGILAAAAAQSATIAMDKTNTNINDDDTHIDSGKSHAADVLMENKICKDNKYVIDDAVEVSTYSAVLANEAAPTEKRSSVVKKVLTKSFARAMKVPTAKKFNVKDAEDKIRKLKVKGVSAKSALKKHFKENVPPQIQKLYKESEKDKKKPGSSKEIAFFKDERKKDLQEIKYGALTKVEYHSGYEINRNGSLNIKKPIWKALTQKELVIKKAANKTIVCRLKEYEDPILGHTFQKGISIKNKQFTIAPKKKVEKQHKKKVLKKKKKQKVKRSVSKALKAIKGFKTSEVSTGLRLAPKNAQKKTKTPIKKKAPRSARPKAKAPRKRGY